MDFFVRPAKTEDLPRILQIYDRARRFMAENGNPTQWGSSYPERSLLEGDIQGGNLYVIGDTHDIHGVFAFFLGADPTYAVIEQGSWRSDAPYGTIHRIASDGTGGMVAAAVFWCRSQISYLRIDTHADNAPMQHVVGKLGFLRSGIIYQPDGSPRIAYELL